MGSTFYSLHYHIIFSTKNRRPLLRSAWRARAHAYLWQEGYAVFSVCWTHVSAVRR